MEKTIGDHLLDALEDLEEADLKKFKAKLHEIRVPEGFDNIPFGRLQRADVVDLSHLLLNYYTDAHAVPVAARVLEGIGARRQAQRLRAAAGIGDKSSDWFPVQSSSASTGGDVQSSRAQTAGGVAPHFIEIHRAQLIQRTSTVEGVLDLLHGSVLDDGQYERITSRQTDQDKMRELYRLVPSWNRSCKDRLYAALKAKNRFLIEDLETMRT